jgi:hypothetical protein
MNQQHGYTQIKTFLLRVSCRPSFDGVCPYSGSCEPYFSALKHPDLDPWLCRQRRDSEEDLDDLHHAPPFLTAIAVQPLPEPPPDFEQNRI